MNSFQVLLASDGTQSYVIFVYGEIEWAFGATIGFYSRNEPFYYFNLLTDRSVLRFSTNIDASGIFGYRVDQNHILEPTG